MMATLEEALAAAAEVAVRLEMALVIARVPYIWL